MAIQTFLLILKNRNLSVLILYQTFNKKIFLSDILTKFNTNQKLLFFVIKTLLVRIKAF